MVGAKVLRSFPTGEGSHHRKVKKLFQIDFLITFVPIPSAKLISLPSHFYILWDRSNLQAS